MPCTSAVIADPSRGASVWGDYDIGMFNVMAFVDGAKRVPMAPRENGGTRIDLPAIAAENQEALFEAVRERFGREAVFTREDVR